MRCFIGIRVEPNKEILQELDKLGRLEYVKTVKPENLQVDLRFLGEVDDPDRILTVLQGIRFKKFSMTIKGLGVFPGHGFIRVVWAGVESQDVYGLKKEVDSALQELGYPPDNRFVPHLTLCRVKRKPDERLRTIIREDGQKFFKVQPVEEFRLYQSVLKREGPEYTVIGRVNLE